MSLMTMRGRQFALLSAVIGLVIGGGRGFAQEGTPPAGDDPMMAHHPAHIHQGSCADPNPEPSYALTEIEMAVGAMAEGPVIPVEISASTIEVKLADLLAQPAAIDVHEVKELGEALAGTVACGDLGGQPTGDVLAVGVKAVNDSGFAGIAVLQAVGDQTTVTLYMAHGLSGAMYDEMTAGAPTTATIPFHTPTLLKEH